MTYLLSVLSLAVAVPIGVFVLECCAALLPARRRYDVAGRRPRVDVLIPAHDEEAVIEATLASVTSELRAGDRVLVVADNCTDATAELARRSGVDVIERFDATRRGKGYALDFGLRSLTSEPEDVVVIVDADCRLAAGTLDHLARAAAATGRPVQAVYRMTPPPRPSPRDVVSSFSVTVKNEARQRGVDRLGVSCTLTGSGMALPRRLFDLVHLADGNIVEDMRLTFELVRLGRGPVFCPAAVVTAPLPQSRHASRAQRTRWEHGHLQTLLHFVPRLFGQGLRRCNPGLIAAALDLAVPPLSLLVLAWCVTTLAAVAAALLGFGLAPCCVSATSGLLLAFAVVAAHARFGHDSLLAVAAAVPRYVVGKLPIYAGFLFRRQTAWVRTDRDVEPRHAHVALRGETSADVGTAVAAGDLR